MSGFNDSITGVANYPVNSEPKNHQRLRPRVVKNQKGS